MAGFDRYVEWCARDGHPETALAGNVRGRSRSLLEQIQLAGVDPRLGLTGPDGERLLKTEADVKRKLGALRARAANSAGTALDAAAAEKLQAAFADARREYADVWRDILNASPVYRNLSMAEFTGAALERLKDDLARSQSFLLVYHLGRDRSYVFTVGKTVLAFELSVPRVVARDAVAPPAVKTEDALAGTRGLVLKSGLRTKDPPAAVRPDVPRVPLTAEVARVLADHYRLAISDPEFLPTRGLALKTRPDAPPLPAQRADLLGDVLLPPAVRAAIRAAGPRTVVVVPDGALHRLPLEAVLLDSGARPRYVLDELPPLVYAPSLAVVRLLIDRDRAAPAGTESLLTVSDPAYPADKAPAKSAVATLLRGSLPPLPFTAVEAQKIRAHFDAGAVTALSGRGATEKAAVARMAGKRFIHLAAHGFADERFGNLFGAVALTPGDPADPADDGVLSLHEIYTLPLKDCELAVLSACVTNVGPQQPLEAGVTLASGFLSAGARHVVASHWSVDDAATAELMEGFFGKLMEAEHAGRPAEFAHALHDSQLRLRNRTRTASPFYWAPFILIGPPDPAGR
jgi:CHAT domain-containing protein